MRKFLIFSVLILFLFSVFVTGYQTGCKRPPFCEDEDGPCGYDGCGGCGCNCMNCGGDPPCNPNCNNKECGSDGCSGICGGTKDCSNEKYAIGCTAGACQFEKAVLKSNVNTPCLDETAASKRFLISGRSEFCGDIKVIVPWNTNPIWIEQDKTYQNYSFQKIIDLPSAYWLPTGPIEIEIIGNRNAKKSTKDDIDYTNKCKDTVLLEINYLNLYYCPDAEDVTVSADGRFDYYDDQAQYIFNSQSYTKWEPDCVSNVQVLSCSPQPTDCVNLVKKTNSQQMEVIGAKWISNGHRLGAYDFDGNSYVKYTGSSGSFNRNDKFSLAAWYIGAESGAIISKMNTNNNFIGYDLFIDNGKLKSHLINTWPSNAIARKGNTNVIDNNWHHLAMTYDGSSTHAGLKIYVDGKLETMTNEGQGISSSILNNMNVLIGARSKGLSSIENAIKGKIDEVKIWDYELTPGQICGQAGKTWNAGVCA